MTSTWAGLSPSSEISPASTRATRTTRSARLPTRHPKRNRRQPPRPPQNTVPVPVGEVKNLLIALDVAADYNRDRAELCADCADQSCPTCELRLREAQAYDRLYVQLDQQADASATTRHLEPAAQPAADREAGQ